MGEHTCQRTTQRVSTRAKGHGSKQSVNISPRDPRTVAQTDPTTNASKLVCNLELFEELTNESYLAPVKIAVL